MVCNFSGVIAIIENTSVPQPVMLGFMQNLVILSFLIHKTFLMIILVIKNLMILQRQKQAKKSQN